MNKHVGISRCIVGENVCIECKQTAERLRAYAAEQVAQWQKATALCPDHQPSGGARSACILCGLLRLSAALSAIDSLCEEPNEMHVSDYDVHMNEQAVIARVKKLREQIRAMQETTTADLASIPELRGQIATLKMEVEQLMKLLEEARAKEREACRHVIISALQSHNPGGRWNWEGYEDEAVEIVEAALRARI